MFAVKNGSLKVKVVPGVAILREMVIAGRIAGVFVKQQKYATAVE